MMGENRVNSASEERLYNLLPAIYRIRDVEKGEPLRALMAVLESEFGRLVGDINGLYDDWFIETCAEWVVPYIGDLLGVRNLHSVASADVYSQRAYVANTLRYRRRKGTAPILEQLARDVTGWPARAVEFFEQLITTQHLNHVRLHSLATVDLGDANQLELLGGPFEDAAHTVDVRRIAVGRGKYNIPNIGLFLWRLQSYSMLQSTPRLAGEADEGRYTFSPLGNDVPLFNRPQTETEITHLAEEINVPGKLRRRALYDELEALRQAIADEAPRPQGIFFASNPVFEVLFKNDEEDEWEAILPEEVLICDLSGDPATGGWRRPGSTKAYIKLNTEEELPIRVAVDPELGRLAFPVGEVPNPLAVSYAYGFSGDLGGGPYDRRGTLARSAPAETWTATVAQHDGDYTSLAAALAAAPADWTDSGAQDQDAIITIADSSTYAEVLNIALKGKQTLVIQAANEKRPTLRLLDDSIDPENPTDLADLVIGGGVGSAASLTLNGLWIEGGIRVEAGSLGALTLTHCTLVPGRGLDIDGAARQPDLPSLVAQLPNADLKVTLNHCITGPLHLPHEISGLQIGDSILHSPLRGGPAKRTPALVSGNLVSFPALSSDAPTLQVSFAGGKPHLVTLAAKPATLAQARDQLQAAIRTAPGDPVFTQQRVLSAAGRLILLPRTPVPLVVSLVEGNPAGAELRLADGSQRAVQALISPPLSPFPALTSNAPGLAVTMNEEGPHVATLASVPASVPRARDALQAAIRAAHPSPAFQNAIVASLADRLIVLPGVEGTAVRFGATDDDQTTLPELGLHEDQPALGGDDAGFQPGPKTTLERTTIFGSTVVREFALVSETIFTGRVEAQRRQAGCTRFSFLPDGSRVPRRYRCQPDLALASFAQQAGKESVEQLTEAQRAAVLARLTPSFTSTCYGEPAYAQLSHACAEEIRTGAEDGSEMGAFSQLKQPQRHANLQAALEEYLRFGLDAGIFYVT